MRISDWSSDVCSSDLIHLLLEKQPQIQYYAPLGIGRWLIQEGVSAKNVAELDWWDEAAFQNMKVVATPLQHWGRRSPLDTNVRLWSGWIVAGRSEERRVGTEWVGTVRSGGGADS